ncbi:MAG: aminoglycoside phosphotransferase family protein [Pseudomonadota bacterium]
MGEADRDRPDPDVLTSLGVTDPECVARTPIANVYRVLRPDRSPAALKIYHGPGLANEGPGLDYLAASRTTAAVKIYRRHGQAVLMEWLPGPSLGDLVRDGREDEASKCLADVARHLHANAPEPPPDWPSLETWFGALLTASPTARCSERARRDFIAAADFARSLLASQPRHIALHGDLHHDNVRLGPRGWFAFDAKGIVGDPCYELANAFRNPKGAGDLLRDADVHRRRASIWTAALGVAEDRLLAWAAAKCALSIAWRAKGEIGADPEFSLLAILLDLARRAGFRAD